MDGDKYVKLEHVQELIKLIKIRDSFNDWSNEYDKYNKKVNNTIDWLERNAKEVRQENVNLYLSDDII